MKNRILSLCALILCAVSQGAEINVSKYVKADGQTDVADALQKLILANPHCTLYFPDGTYLLSKPICTPAQASRSVCLRLDPYAIIKAAPQWTNTEAMVRLGGIFYNNRLSTGADYFLRGGIIDGSGVATGVSIESGRQTHIKDVTIRNTQIGLHVQSLPRNGSTDADIEHVNIEGNGQKGSIGVLNTSYDNTFSHMRVNNFQIGVKDSGGGCWRDIHVFNYKTYKGNPEYYANSIGFWSIPNAPLYNFCYADNYATAFYIEQRGEIARLRDCWAFWFSSHEGCKYTAIKTKGDFRSLVDGLMWGAPNDSKAEFRLAEMVGEGKIKGGHVSGFRPSGKKPILNDFEKALLKD